MSFEAVLICLDGGKQKMMNTCNAQSLAIRALASSFLVSSDELGGTEHLPLSSSTSFITLTTSRMPLHSAMEKHPAWLLVCLQELLLYRYDQFLSKGQTITVTPQKDLLLVPKSWSWAHPKYCKNYSGNLCSWVLALSCQQGKAENKIYKSLSPYGSVVILPIYTHTLDV